MVDIYQCCLVLNSDEILIGTTEGNVFKRKFRDINELKNMDFANEVNFINALEDFSEHILKMEGTIRSIQSLSDDKCIILSDFGGIQIYKIDTQDFTVINDESHSSSSKIWRMLIIDQFSFITVGNYGEMTLWDISNNEIQKDNHYRDRHAFFCLDWLRYKERIFLTNNYIGDCYMWKLERSSLIEVDSFNLNRNLQKITQVDDYLIAVSYYGRVYIYKKDESKFKRVFEFNIGDSRGNWVYYSQLNEQILIATNNRLLYLDKNFQQIKELNLISKQILEHEGLVLVLSNKSIVIPNIGNAEPPETLVDYKYKKISLVGDSQVGKTSFCKYLESGDGVTETSTIGTHVWSIFHGSDSEENQFFDDFEHRILYFDLAGQKEEHFTYFPKIYDSDIILLFYQGIKPETFMQAMSYYKELSGKCPNTEFYFIQTFSEQRARVFDRTIMREFNANGLSVEDNLIKISSKTGEGFDAYKTKVLDKIEWENATAVFRIPLYDELESIIHSFYRNGQVNKLTLKELGIALNLDESRLHLIVNSYYEQGFFEYIEDEKLILINNYEYAQVQSDIANLIVQEEGYAKTTLIYQEVDPLKENNIFIKNMLEYYRKNNIGAIFKENDANKETFIFPRKLVENLDSLNNIEHDLPVFQYIFEYSNYDLKIEDILNIFSRYSLNLEKISKREVILRGDQIINPTLIYLKFNFETGNESKTCSFGILKADSADYVMESDIIQIFHDLLKDHIVDMPVLEVNSFSLEEIENDSYFIKKLLNLPYERSFIDFKVQLSLSNNAEIAEFVKDVIALTNMAYQNHNISYLIVGIEEKNCEILGIQDVPNFSPLEQQITQRIEEFILNPPIPSIVPINIIDVYNWQQDDKIPTSIPFTSDQKLNGNLRLMIIKLSRQSGKVCEIKKKIIFINNKNRSVDYDVGDSWIRLGSHTFGISELFREMIRIKE